MDELINVLKKHPEGLTAREIAKETGRNLSWVYFVANRLELKGIIKVERAKSKYKPKIYKLVQNG
ncbi:MAG: helix-turn-helix domain-containing protein [Candidatus Heimdallarchaeaceae archaeon]